MASDAGVVPCAHRGPPGKYLNSKRLVVCCDGTWNNTNDLGRGPPSNVSRLSGAVAHKCCTGKPQIVYYHPGAGTEASWVARQAGGMFGIGVAQDIVESYRFICDNYNPGDEIIIIGFSRGAFTARSVADMVCNLGFLNRSGLDHLPEIFRDYERWQDWTSPQLYNEKEHLTAFTVQNLQRVKRFAMRNKMDRVEAPWEGTEEGLAEQLATEKRELFAKMTQHVETVNGKSRMNLIEIGHLYRAKLNEHMMCLPEKDAEGNYMPHPGAVRAVGIWDTVGSLGMPRMPWVINSSRKDDEIRFASLEVDPRVDYAFHALALDEWRTAFGPTMWDKGKNNNNTHLRQVWFPGNHGGVGGGWEDQQIATIALAWMADQLTSVGVEFSRPEMQRIFYTLEPGVKPRDWAMGKIYNPTGLTAAPDRVFNGAMAPVRLLTGKNRPSRTPGLYSTDGVSGNTGLLNDPNELVHPCVRIRYLYDGNGMDDDGAWDCRALVDNGYELVGEEVPSNNKPIALRPNRVDGALRPYYTVSGGVVPYYDTPDTNDISSSSGLLRVRTEQPSESDLLKLENNKVVERWYWKRKDVGDGKEVPKSKVLEEEQLGMWERMYIKINEKLLDWQKTEDGRNQQDAVGKDTERWAITRGIRNAWTSTASFVSSAWTSVTSWNAAKRVVRATALLSGDRAVYGYHDMISWQTGDLSGSLRRIGNGSGTA